MKETPTRAELHDPKEIKSFMLAGNAICTLENAKSRQHVTFKIRKPEKGKPSFFVRFLAGSDNNQDYRYLGYIPDGKEFRFTSCSPSPKCKSARGFKWLWKKIQQSTPLPEPMHFYHEGRCGRCGRRLTEPESLKIGLGPVCRGAR